MVNSVHGIFIPALASLICFICAFASHASDGESLYENLVELRDAARTEEAGQSVALADDLLEQLPYLAEIYNLRGIALAYSGELEAALGSFSTAALVLPNYPEAIHNKNTLVRQLLKKSMGREPASGDNLGLDESPLVESASQIQDYIDCFALDMRTIPVTCTRIIDRQPKFGWAYLSRSLKRSETNLDLAVKDYTEGLSQLVAASPADGAEPGPFLDFDVQKLGLALAHKRIDLAVERLKQGKIEDGRAQLLRAPETSSGTDRSSWPGGHRFLNMISGQNRTSSQLFEIASQAAQEDPSDFVAHFWAGFYAIKLGDLETARKALRRSLELNETPESSAWLGFIETGERNYKAAASYFEQSLRLNPDQPKVIEDLVDAIRLARD